MKKDLERGGVSRLTVAYAATIVRQLSERMHSGPRDEVVLYEMRLILLIQSILFSRLFGWQARYLACGLGSGPKHANYIAHLMRRLLKITED